ncbi:hypothetical protein Igag_0738 [Ignisphaera aggregans DSM 17230]|uniref:Uncharacterized protein n=1 Tax=Ignisphaera aggregans (strain DSM 17230 / JCM 13409 / AQ1.S1) TaxID=583356 RepID=E0ST91_IGNAA|nr:hypothetical protein Igag_0738 [Ignisphaera aggregans DSM 17230]
MSSNIIRCLETLRRSFRATPDVCIEVDSRESVESFIDEHCNKSLRASGYAVKIVKSFPWARGKPDYFMRLVRVQQ